MPATSSSATASRAVPARRRRAASYSTPDCELELDGRHARLRSGAVEVEVAASLPLAAEPAEWYPDLYVARPTTRLVYRFRAGDPPRRDHALAQAAVRRSRPGGVVKVFVVDQSLFGLLYDVQFSAALAAAGADATLEWGGPLQVAYRR